MKNLTLIISLLFCFGIAVFSQDPLSGQTVESFSLSIIIDSLKQLIVSVNWLFVIVFMLVTWLVNDTSEAINTNSPNWFNKIPKVIRALFIGILGIILFAWSNQVQSRSEIFKLILSLLMAMVIFKFGINKILRYLSTRIGLKFE